MRLPSCRLCCPNDRCSSETAALVSSSPADNTTTTTTTTTNANTTTTTTDNNNSHASLREWVSWLTSQSSSPGTSRGGLGGQESQELPERHPYKGVFVGCESLDAVETESLCEDLVKAVFTRLVEEE